MGAIYGILGESEPSEMAAIGGRLLHRGGSGSDWRASPSLRLGMQAPAGVDRLQGGPIAFDGAVDNRNEIARVVGRTAAPEPDAEQDGLLVLALYQQLGADGFARLAGQFACAIWDARHGCLVLARDIIGYSPLYHTYDRGRFAFASEYKALLALPELMPRPNRDAIQVLQATKWTKPGATCLVDVYPVAPGTWLEVTPERAHTARYWNIPVRAEHTNEARHASALRTTFVETMRQQLAPYQRIGVSLSGGLDSAVMTAGARHVAAGRDVHTFSAGYGEDDRELVNAAQVARELETIHHPLVLDPADLPALLPWMVWHIEEPIGREDIAYLYVTAREAGRFVDVVLTGFGFDGLFAGLPRHRIADLALKLPPVAGPLAEFYDYTFRSVPPHSLIGRALKAGWFRGRDYAAPSVLGATPVAPFPGFPRAASQPLTRFLQGGFMVSPYQSPVERLYAASNVRMNAHHTDPAFLAAAFSIPDSLKIHGRTQKYILRKACEGLLPNEMLAVGKSFNRLKHDEQMSAVLDQMAETLLPDHTVRERGLFDPSYVARLRQRKPGRPYPQERAYRLWSMLLVEMWSQLYLDRRGAPPDVALPPVRQLGAAVAMS